MAFHDGSAVFRKMRKNTSPPPGSQEPHSLTRNTSTSPLTLHLATCSVARWVVRSDSTSKGVASGSGLKESCLSSLKVDYSFCAQFLESRWLAASLGATTQWRSLRGQTKGRFDDWGASSYTCVVLSPPQAAPFRETDPKHMGEKLFRAQNEEEI